MNDLKLDSITHDLQFNNFDLQIIDDDDELIQRLKIKFQFFFGEFFLDTSKGIQFVEEINKKSPNIDTVDNIFKRTILEEPEFKELTEYTATFDLFNRTYSISFRVKKIDDTILTFSESLSL